MILLGVYVTLHTLGEPWEQWTYGHVVSPLSWFGVGAMCLLAVWMLPRERYLLRPGAGRYVVGTITEHYWQRGRHKYVIVYYVDGQRWQTAEACGMADWQNLPCPALGARLYVYFAPKDPTVQQVLAVPVPDTLRTVPPRGWARLP